MQAVAIITDSTSDLPADVCAEHGITVVPLALTIDGETMTDGTLSQPEFFKRMNAAAELPTTSQPSVGAFVETYRLALEEASHVVSVHISEKLSGTLASARAAAEQFAGQVTVVDSKNLSWALGFQVLEAARAAASGLEPAAIVERVESVRDRVQLLVSLDALDNLVKGGRISSFAGKVGGALNVRLAITVKDGAFVPVRPYRSAKAAFNHGLQWIENRMEGTKRGAFCVIHALSEERAIALKEAITERFDPSELYLAETGTVIATHTGVGWGVAFVPEK